MAKLLGVNHSEFPLATADGLALHAHGWSPEGDPIGTVVVVHGLGEHAGRYHHVGERLAASGYEVIAYDQRGHGRSEGPRGHAPSYDHLLEDLDTVLRGVQDDAEREPPLFLYGHSLGGGLVLNHALRRSSVTVAGVIASSPLLLPTKMPPAWKVHTAKLLNRVLPRIRFRANIGPTARSHDPQVEINFTADPLTQDFVTARLGVEMLRESRWALEHAAPLPVPALLMHGDDDPITCCDATRRFADASGADLRVWHEKRHELHWEDNRDEVLNAVVEWLDEAGVSRAS